ncbi:MAG: hypothetical protein V2I97_04950 [Desulfococcaceae bacterium]|jgi:hypothetical protein|nr:hypothetical protein [Desulfococcaceae bacterium]
MKNFIKKEYPQYYSEDVNIVYDYAASQDSARTINEKIILIPMGYFVKECLSHPEQSTLFDMLAHEYQHVNDLKSFNFIEDIFYSWDMFLQDYKFKGIWENRHKEIYQNAVDANVESHWEHYKSCP